MFFLLLTGCSDTLPNERLDYVGDWRGEEMHLVINADGRIDYKRSRKGGSTTINAPIQEFIGDDFTVGILFLTTTFDVSEPPSLENGVWRMTVDGVQLTKTNK